MNTPLLDRIAAQRNGKPLSTQQPVRPLVPAPISPWVQRQLENRGVAKEMSR